MEKLLIMSNLFFCQHVLKSSILQSVCVWERFKWRHLMNTSCKSQADFIMCHPRNVHIHFISISYSFPYSFHIHFIFISYSFHLFNVRNFSAILFFSAMCNYLVFQQFMYIDVIRSLIHALFPHVFICVFTGK